VLVAVEEDADTLRDVERELRERYALHYRVIAMDSSSEALACLEELAREGEQVALVLAGQDLSGTTAGDLLGEARRLHPEAKRGLLIPWGGWGERATGRAIRESVVRGGADHYVLRPITSPDELFHQAISTFLLEWADSQRTSAHTIRVVGESWSGRAYELRRTLGRCALPHSFCLADSAEGRALLARVGADAGLPLILLPDGTALTDPSDAEIALATGSPVEPHGDRFDLVIVGAGPAGLSAAVYGASEGFTTLVVDDGGVGGQATSSSLIRNYLGFARGVSGGRLAQQAYEQAWIFGASFAFMQRATALGRDDDGLSVSLSVSGRVRARSVVLATGASYRRLGVPALEALNGAGVFYGGTASEAPAMGGRDVYVLGGANSAGQTALHLARYARRVTLVVRAPSLAAGMSRYLVEQVEATRNLEVRLGTEVVGGGGDGWLSHLRLRRRGAAGEETVDADALFLAIGARPRTDWLPPEIVRDEQGFVLTGPDLAELAAWPLERRPFLLESSVPGVLAVGDVRSGSVKRVAAAVGEGSAAVQVLHRLVVADGSRPRAGPPDADVASGR
jgi:thioredoxin reductase (NADPH)